MLAIQKFCKENKNWKSLLKKEPYCLKISEKENLVLFKYDQIRSDFSQEICQECRGIILEKDSWRVVRMAFKKFFNYEEPLAAQIDWNSASASSKEDGSLISLYYYNGWQIATNSRINAKDASISCSLFDSFYDLAIKAFDLYKLNFEQLNKNYTYTFELCSPYNFVVCRYEKISLFLTCVRDNTTLEELDVVLPEIPRPQFYKLNSKDEYEKLVAELGENREGIVVKDKNNNRVKMKTLLYFKLHRMVNGVLNLESVVNLILSNDTDEFLSYFPVYKPYINKMKEAIEKGFEEVNKVNDFVNNWKNENKDAPRGVFARMVSKFDFPAIYFIAYDDRDVKSYVKDLGAKRIINLFKLYDVEKEIKDEIF